MRAWSAQRWVVAGMVVVLVASIGAWWATRDPLPRTIRIATAKPGGLYEAFGRALAENLEGSTGVSVELVSTNGSIENSQLLDAGEVHLAILQATALRRASVSLPALAVLAPLYPEVVHVIVRADSEIRSIAELAGRALSIGPVGSGMRESAAALLDHYRIAIEEIERDAAFFEDLTGDPTLEGAIVTTGLDNPSLTALLDAGDYRLLPVLDSEAIALANPFFVPFAIPRGFFDERPPLPAEETPTVASTAVLAARKDCSETLIAAALRALYERDLRPEFPHSIQRRDALAQAPIPVHPAVRKFLDPYGGLDVVASLIEAVSGIKELLVGFIALIYLLFNFLRRRDQSRRERELQGLKDHLDEYLTRTVSLERAQMETDDPEQLRQLQREVTRVKLEALEELTAEDLRADQSFQIFLTQCANLSQKIQGRIQLLRSGP